MIKASALESLELRRLLSGGTDVLVNNNAGAGASANFTQSETSVIAFGNTVVVGFNDSGSNSGGTSSFTGFSRSTDGGATFTDGGTLPTNSGGDAGDPILARDNGTGRIYFATLGFNVDTIQVFRSDDSGATWQAPTNGTPGGASEDKQWMTVDNYAGGGNGNVYILSRRFSGAQGIYLFRSTDGGATFGPSGGVAITTSSPMQGAYVAIGPDHSVYCFWLAGTNIQVRKSVDFGATFGAPVTVVSGLAGGTNGDLGLTGIRQGTATASGFRSNKFPHVAVNEVSGHLYVTYANIGSGGDKADIFFRMSTDGGATWSAAVQVNDDGTTTDQWMPTIAATPDGSRLGIFYYSRQDDPVNNNLFRYYGRIATISGATVTFDASSAISDVASLPEFGRDSVVNSTYMGDYDQTSATNDAFHVVWSDSRDDLSGGAPRKDPNVYYDKVLLGLAVVGTVPAVNSVVGTTPTSYIVNFSEPIISGSVQATDFTVNSIPADSFVVNTSQQVTFTFNVSPVTAQGLQTMAIPAGSITRQVDGDGNLAFSGGFRYDINVMQVTSTAPPTPNGVFTLPTPFTLDVNLNEPVDPASVQTGDLTLGGVGGTVTGVTVLPGNTTLRFTIGGTTVEGALTASIGASRITDVFGNGNAAFAGTYNVDIGTVGYPAPLTPKGPAGSLIHDPSAAGVIGNPGDVDSFTLNIDPRQTISLLVTPGDPTLQATVEVRDPSNALIGNATATSAGVNALVQTVATTTGGLYTFKVSGAGGSIGAYTVQLVLNAALDREGRIPGASNNTLATAQNINGSFITLPTSLTSGQRGAVTGTFDAGYGAAAITPTFEDISGTGAVLAGLTNVDDVSVTTPIGFTFNYFGVNYTSVFVSSNGLMTFGTSNTSFTNTDLTTAPTQTAIAVFWDDLHTGGGAANSNVYTQVLGSGANQHLTVQWNEVRFFNGGTAGDTITFQAQLYADGRVQLNYLDLTSAGAPGSEGASASVGGKAAGTQGPDRILLAFDDGPNTYVGSNQSTLITNISGADYYSFTMAAGQTTSLALKAVGASLGLVELLDSGGAVLATGVSGSTNVDSVISNYTALSSGTYFIRVTGNSSADFNLLVMRDSVFDTEDNSSLATAQAMSPSRGALGSLISGSAGYSASVITPTFENISGTGTIVSALTNVDDASTSVSIGFPFQFYGTSYTDVFVSSNGLLTFGTANSSFTNTDLTATPTQASIAVFWDDLHTGGGAPNSNVYTQVTGSGANQHLTIQWNEIRFFTGGTAGDTITFQAQLYVDGRVQLNYSDLVSGTAPGNNGASATAGIKAAGAQGLDRLLLAFNNGPNIYVGTNLSTMLTGTALADFYTVAATAGDLIRVESSTPGDGAGEPVNLLDPDLELYDPSGVLVASGITLGDLRNESISHTALQTGLYSVRVSNDNSTSGDYFVNAIVNTVAPKVLNSAFLFETAPQRVAFHFDQNVGASLSLSDFTVQNLDNLATVTPTGLTYDSITNTAYLSFTTPLPNANFRATAVAAGISNGSGTPMAANSVLDFFFLQADANRDRTVNSADFNILATNFGTTAKFFSQGNFSYDLAGDVNSADFNLLAIGFGTSLPGGSGDESRSSGSSQGGSGDLYLGDRTVYPPGGLFGDSRLMGGLFGDSEKIDFELPGSKA